MMKRIAKAGALYFLLVFALGALFGVVREFWIAPRFGPTVGVLFETPFMLLAIVLIAMFVVRHFTIPATFAPRAAVGVLAFGCLVVAELMGAVWLRGLSVAEYAAGFVSPSGLASLIMFCLFAAMPVLLRRL